MLIKNNCKMVYPKHSVIMVAMHIWNTPDSVTNVPSKQY